MTPAVVVVAASVALLVPNSHAIAAAKPHAIATLTTSPPVFDGSLDDTAWGLAIATDSFTQKVPTDGMPPANAPPCEFSTISVSISILALNVSSDARASSSGCHDAIAKWSPIVSSSLSTAAGRVRALSNSVSTRQACWSDLLRFNDTEQSFDWDENWEAKMRIGADKWTAELRIPFRILRFSGAQRTLIWLSGPALPVRETRAR